MPGRRRACSTSSQSSIASIYTRIHQSSTLAKPQQGTANVWGSFTTTIPATLWLRDQLTLSIPVAGKYRARRHDRTGYDTPPDSPLSFFQSTRRSPSISRTLTDVECAGSDTPSPSMSPVTDNSDLHPVLGALERGSLLSCTSVCSACMKVGTNFPRCPRCDEMWCSRACRLQGGKKHVCAIRRT